MSSSHPTSHTNRLAASQSPYLLQHAGNPVDWYPWGDEAISTARARGVPLFVSIGYSTCYWCHVMERESFEDPVAAELLNRVCVPVKVDREERPDVDELMMSACQVFTQLTEGRPSGGWPLNVFLDPDTLEPFHAGTYYPPKPGYGRPSFVELLKAVHAAWTQDRAGLRAQAAHLARAVRAQGAVGVESPALEGQHTSVGWTALASGELEQQVVDALMRAHDPTNGGFGGAPKFPTPPYPLFLLLTRGDEPGVQRALQHTLDRMAVGGICDHVGGGFHRYAVDATWTVPHFEKMLYDNAQLALVYALAAERWADEWYAQVARRTLDYVLREMTGPEGRFYSAQDAEVAAREGGNYVWTRQQAQEALAGMEAADRAIALRAYGLDGGPNFQDPHHAQEPPSYVLRMDARPLEVARALGVSVPHLTAVLERANALMYAVRAERPQPLTDDNSVAAWSGLMIEALALAAQACRAPEYAVAGARAAEFILAHMRTPDGGLVRVWRNGQGAVAGFLQDYACVANGLLMLERVKGGEKWGRAAAELMAHAHSQFCDPVTGRWFDTVAGDTQLFMRGQEMDDGAVPSGMSSALRALIGLAKIRAPAPSGDWAAMAERWLTAVAPAVLEQPVSCTGTLLCARALRRLRESDPAGGPEHPVHFSLHATGNPRIFTLVATVAAEHHVTGGGSFTLSAGPGMPALTDVAGGAPSELVGRIEIPVEFASAPTAPASVMVGWQVCTARECRPPQETLVRDTLTRSP